MKNEEQIQMIEIAQILIANPRPRNRVKFQAIVASIEAVGLKRPILVNDRASAGGGFRYELVCGQGRMEAFMVLGKTAIPSIITEVTREQLYLMSLVENIARRPPSNRALLVEVRSLLDRGYKAEAIAEKLGVEKSHAYGMVQLLKNGEAALLQAVDAGRIPLRIAIIISTGTDEEVQSALIEAYEKGDLRGSKLATARRIIAMRLARERGTGRATQNKRKLSAGVLIEEYEQHVQQQRIAVGRLNAVNHRLTILSAAMRRLLQDENLVTLLRAESIQEIPRHIAERIG
jgi:ParB family transcriptional regulator, chromosome partitioning protein